MAQMDETRRAGASSSSGRTRVRVARPEAIATLVAGGPDVDCGGAGKHLLFFALAYCHDLLHYHLKSGSAAGCAKYGSILTNRMRLTPLTHVTDPFRTLFLSGLAARPQPAPCARTHGVPVILALPFPLIAQSCFFGGTGPARGVGLLLRNTLEPRRVNGFILEYLWIMPQALAKNYVSLSRRAADGRLERFSKI